MIEIPFTGGVTETCEMIAWNYQVYVAGGKIKAEKQLSLWVGTKEAEDRLHWHRIRYLRLPLCWHICRLENGKPVRVTENTDDYVRVTDDAIHFDGGFLQICDPGLARQLDIWGISLADEKVIKSLLNPKCPTLSYTPRFRHEILRDVLTETDIPEGMTSLSHVDLLLSQLNEKLSQEEIKIIEKVKESILQSPTELSRQQAKDALIGAILDRLIFNRGKKLTRLQPHGRSIYFEVDCAPETEQRYQPLCWLPQHDQKNSIIELSLVSSQKDSLRRHVRWQISDEIERTDSYELESAQARHTISVNQDTNWFRTTEEGIGKKGNEKGTLDSREEQEEKQGATENNVETDELKAFWEIAVDSIALPTMSRHAISLDGKEIHNDAELYEAGHSHHFGVNGRTFYIGYGAKIPYLAKADSEPAKEKIFRGRIYRFFFDPNSSCPAC